MNTNPHDSSPEDIGFDWVTLDSHISTAAREIEAALEAALAATRNLNQWVERRHTVSAFMQQVESGLAEVRQKLKVPPQVRPTAPAPLGVPEAAAAQVGEAWPLEPDLPEVDEDPLLVSLKPQEVEEAESRAEPSEAAVAEVEECPMPAEEEPSERPAPVAKVGGTIPLVIESSEANIALMVLERVLRETPGVADFALLDYGGRRARVRVALSDGERPEEVADPQRLAANVQERVAKLSWDRTLSVCSVE